MKKKRFPVEQITAQVVRIDAAHGFIDWLYWPEWTPEGLKWRGRFFPRIAIGTMSCVIPAW